MTHASPRLRGRGNNNASLELEKNVRAQHWRPFYRRSSISLCMSLSGQQQRLVRLLKQGSQLRIVRSALNQSPVYCELVATEAATEVEVIAMWRIHKLLATGVVHLDTGQISTARAIVVSVRPSEDDFV